MTDPWWSQLCEGEKDRLLESALLADPELDARLRTQHRASAGDVAELRELVDDMLRTRRYLDWRQTREYADDAWPVVQALANAADSAASTELVELVQRALSHVLKVLHRADDDGLIGDVFDRLLDVHVRACRQAGPDQSRLAKWLIKATYDDDWFSPPDPVPYADALGEKGVALYRQAAERELSAVDGTDRYATGLSHGRYAVERLAVIDRDADAVVASFDHIERAGYRETEIASALREIGRDDLALAHARAGLADAGPYDQRRLAPIADAILSESGDAEGLLGLRRVHHQLLPDRTTYAALRDASTALHRWDDDRPAAIVALGRTSPGELIVVLLAEGKVDEAWSTYRAAETVSFHEKDELALIAARGVDHPGDALDAYLRLADAELVNTGRDHYERAIHLLKKGVEPAARSGREADLRAHIEQLRATYKNRPTLIALLDRAALDRPRS